MTLQRMILRVLFGTASLWLAAGARADAVVDWNQRAHAAAVAACIVPGENPLHESRLYAMVHLASTMHSTPFSGDRGHMPITPRHAAGRQATQRLRRLHATFWSARFH